MKKFYAKLGVSKIKILRKNYDFTCVEMFYKKYRLKKLYEYISR